MQKKFAYLDCFNDWKEIPVKGLAKYYKEKGLKRYILKHFPHQFQEMMYGEAEGYHIYLPFVKMGNSEDTEFIKEVIKLFNENLVDNEIQVVILDPFLKAYKDEFPMIVAEGNALGILYLEKVLELLQPRFKKDPKNLHYVLVDGKTGTTEYILDKLSYNINALTIVTEDPRRFDDYILDVFNETGLAISIKDKSLKQTIEGDVILHCTNNYEKLYYCYAPGAIVVDFLTDADIIRNMKIKRKDLTFVYDCSVDFQEKRWHKDDFMAMLLAQNRLIRTLYQYGYQCEMKDRLAKILANYPLEFHIKSL